MRPGLFYNRQTVLQIVLSIILLICVCASSVYAQVLTLSYPKSIADKVTPGPYQPDFSLDLLIRGLGVPAAQVLPVWATWWAILLYGLLAVSVVYGLVQAYLNQQEAKQLMAIDALKKRFYANITHEFRTPLTLILAPAEQLKQRLTNPNDQQQVELITQNATQLLSLVNQLMELSKAEDNLLKVKESQGDIVAFLARLIQSFDLQANAKGIQIILRPEKDAAYYWFDADKLERIVYNLLANALKCTPVGGRIIMNVATANDLESIELSKVHSEQRSRVHLEISDNGVGTSPEKLPYIFDRFYPVDDSSLDQPNGFDSGLALVKELVDIQQGTIQVVSKVSIGTTFLIDLPYRPATDAFVATQSAVVTQPPTTDQKESVNEQPLAEAPTILIVEDNKGLSDFIADNLPTIYRVHRAVNGAEGWEKALHILPDLVISDILMPVMNGYELCQQLKKDSRTSHIPVILLTAKTSIDSKLEGLSSGADDYMAKPFYVQELQLRIRNLLEQRQQLRKWALSIITNPDPLPNSSSPPDPLIEKLCQIIENHLDDKTFGVDELILASGMSRMNLHRKLKVLVDIPTGEFIRNYRLKRAAQLLRQGRSVSETAYLVGFEDPSYFARSFRKLYQMTPSDYSRRK